MYQSSSFSMTAVNSFRMFAYYYMNGIDMDEVDYGKTMVSWQRGFDARGAGRSRVATNLIDEISNCLYNISMTYEWDAAKNEANITVGRLGFEEMEGFEWATATVERSDRHGEMRWAATGYIGDRLHRVVYTSRGDRRRIISLRIASKREEREYAKA